MVVERGIPIPPKCERASEFCKTVRGMKPDESILVDTSHKMDHARKIIKALGGKSVTRKVEGGWRIWRIA